MQKRTLALASTLIAACMLAACSGGGTSGGGNPIVIPTTNPGPQPNPNGPLQDAIAAMNSVGAPIQGNSDSNEQGGGGGGPVTGTCTTTGSTSVWFQSPDKNGDANSTERIKYYDTACTQVAVDTVRMFTSTGSGSETVTRTITKYTQGQTTPTSIRTETVNYANGTFDALGYPVVTTGLVRQATSQIAINGVVTANTSDEYIAGAISNSGTTTTMAYCGDTAGYSTTGVQALSEAFGWSSLTDSNNGARVTDSTKPGVVTFTANRIGTTYVGPVGTMSVSAASSQNSACPIASPTYTVSVTGGNLQNNFMVPIVMTFTSGYLTNLTVTNGQLAHGEILNVTTSGSGKMGNSNFINGTLTTSSGSPIASFGVSAFGIGTLTMVTGQTLNIVDWHVVN